MQQLTKRILSFILLSVFLFYITPKELLHAFTHHTDTQHEPVKSGLQISNEHHHCELLKLDQQFSAWDVQLPHHNFENTTPSYPDILGGKANHTFYSKWFSSQSSRGPPVA